MRWRERIVSENLFQYPTEKSVRKMALACLRRLDALQDETLVQAIATQSSDGQSSMPVCHDETVSTCSRDLWLP